MPDPDETDEYDPFWDQVDHAYDIRIDNLTERQRNV